MDGLFTKGIPIIIIIACLFVSAKIIISAIEEWRRTKNELTGK
jgi:hypothetical protein